METYLPTMSIAGILGFFAPMAIAVVNQPRWSPEAKRIVALVLSVLLAVIAMFATNAFVVLNATTIWTLLFMVVGVSQSAYALIFKPLGISGAIEEKTSPQRISETEEDTVE